MQTDTFTELADIIKNTMTSPISYVVVQEIQLQAFFSISVQPWGILHVLDDQIKVLRNPFQLSSSETRIKFISYTYFQVQIFIYLDILGLLVTVYLLKIVWILLGPDDYN